MTDFGYDTAKRGFGKPPRGLPVLMTSSTQLKLDGKDFDFGYMTKGAQAHPLVDIFSYY